MDTQVIILIGRNFTQSFFKQYAEKINDSQTYFVDGLGGFMMLECFKILRYSKEAQLFVVSVICWVMGHTHVSAG
jgi:hypothetical protein